MPAAGGGPGGAWSGGSGTLPQAASIPTITAAQPRDNQLLLLMLLILLEALLALALLVLIVWWTMFSGRPKGEPPASADDQDEKGR